jgi:hypothetical protein|tara:strand:+ start:121 stop:459 length:339 start_codon:yes stop_codon:yes gene_type:complete
MGYTNYWYQNKPFTDQEWKKVKDEFEYIKEMSSDVIDETRKVDEIVFNGKGDLSHETFVLTKNPRTKEQYKGEDLSFNFCKTAEKPYDLAVWHLLFFAKNKTKALSEISRDR